MPSGLRVGIVGGGLSGLAAAYYLTRANAAEGLDLEITLLEKASRLGGVIRSRRVGEFLLEDGPEAFVSYKPAAQGLADELGLGADLLGSRDDRRKVYVLDGEGLNPLPDGMIFLAPVRRRAFWSTASLSPAGKVRALLEPWIPRSRMDTSVRKFFHRRLGREFTRRVAEPLVSAIYGGSIRQLSMESALPLLYRLEQNQGSLRKGFLRRPLENSSRPLPLFLTLRNGMQQLTDGLRRRLPGVRIRTGVSGLRLTAVDGSRYRLQGDGFDEVQDAVILSTPAPAASRILAGLAAEDSSPLSRVPYTSTRIVYLAYRRSEFSHPLNGFGFVASEGADTVLDACTWVSSKFDERCPPDSVLIRCAVHDGRRRRAAMSEDESVARTHQELRRVLKIYCAPTRALAVERAAPY
ncbi:MAG: protoporphyrinogen oxidase, partial [Candidatus Aminicenantes bacterium]|nr:protoporphyrinogen oxidase [Candidatus Aminicenantes bacterium]